MPFRGSLEELHQANPRRRPGFDELVEEYDELRTQIASTAYVTPRRSSPIAGRRRLISISAAGALLSVAAVLTVVLLSGGSTESAYAAANKALAATSAGALDSGTMVIKLARDGAVYQVDTTSWNGSNLSLSLTGSGYDEALRLVGQDAYVLRSEDGRWTHYEMTEPGSPGKKLVEMLTVARADVAGTTASDVIALTTGLQKTERADGSTVYKGTVKAGTTAGKLSNASSAIRTIAKANKVGLDVTIEMIAGSDGLVDQVIASYQNDDAAWTWITDYNQLDSTPAITAPAAGKIVEAKPVEPKTTGAPPSQTTSNG